MAWVQRYLNVEFGEFSPAGRTDIYAQYLRLQASKASPPAMSGAGPDAPRAKNLIPLAKPVSLVTGHIHTFYAVRPVFATR